MDMPTKRFALEVEMQHEAVLPHGLQRLTTLLHENPGHPISRDTVRLAAKNPDAGLKMVELLLQQQGTRNHINDHEVYVNAVSNQTQGLEILKLLLKLGCQVTETMMEVATLQGGNSVEYVAVLLKHGGKITDLVMEKAMRDTTQGVQVLKLLLEHGANPTEACIEIAAGHELMGLEYVKLLIEHGGKIGDEILKKAMRNCTQGVGILKLLLEHGASVTEDCMIFAAALELIDNVDKKILNQHGHKQNFEPVFSDRRREINLFKFLLEYRGEPTELPSIEYLKLLLEHGGEASEPVMVAATDNEKCAPQFCEILLSHGGQITEEVMVSTLFSENFPIRLLKLFIAHGAKVTMELLDLAEIPQSDGKPEVYDFIDRALMKQRLLRLRFDLEEGKRIAAISEMPI